MLNSLSSDATADEPDYSQILTRKPAVCLGSAAPRGGLRSWLNIIHLLFITPASGARLGCLQALLTAAPPVKVVSRLRS